MTKALFTGLAALIAIGGAASAQDVFPKVNPGEWEYVAKTKVNVVSNGVPIAIPEQVSTEVKCVTAEEADLKPDEDDLEEGCTILGVQSDATFVNMQVSCIANGQKIDGSVETKVHDAGNRIHTVFSAKGGDAATQLDINAVVTGELKGACTE